MRLWLRIPAEGLRRALADLLTGAGHEVSTASSAPPDPDLQILLAPDGALPSGRPATLFLRPAPGRAADADPPGALRRALAAGGSAVWGSPLDPALLVATLGDTSGSRRTVGTGAYPLLEASPWIWLLVDPRTRRIVWANAPARERFGLPGEGEVPVLDLVPPSLYTQPEGRERTRVLGRPGLAVWWTETNQRRCLGLLEIAPADGAEAEGSLRALAEIGRMTSTFAHEVRNPIASLAGALDLLREDLAPSERVEVAALAKERLALMRRLLDDMLRLARPLRGDPETFEMGPLVASTLSATRTDPLFAGVRIETDLGEETVTVRAHPEPLRQAVMNLLLNAAEAQEGRGVIRIRLRREAGMAALEVQDEGPGIPPERRQTVFDPFWTTKTRGTGLGLALVKRVAEAVGGRASVEDSPRGARLRIEIPVTS